MERDCLKYVRDMNISNFNSHAHVERDYRCISIIRYIVISTHTLTWSVTSVTPDSIAAPSISTHTLTWSVTYISKEK